MSIVETIAKYRKAIRDVRPNMLSGDVTITIAWTIAEQYGLTYIQAFDLVKKEGDHHVRQQSEGISGGREASVIVS